jgi:hypothetical protein
LSLIEAHPTAGIPGPLHESPCSDDNVRIKSRQFAYRTEQRKTSQCASCSSSSSSRFSALFREAAGPLLHEPRPEIRVSKRRLWPWAVRAAKSDFKFPAKFPLVATSSKSLVRAEQRAGQYHSTVTSSWHGYSYGRPCVYIKIIVRLGCRPSALSLLEPEGFIIAPLTSLSPDPG